jgi:hypothetical protein
MPSEVQVERAIALICRVVATTSISSNSCRIRIGLAVGEARSVQPSASAGAFQDCTAFSMAGGSYSLRMVQRWRLRR